MGRTPLSLVASLGYVAIADALLNAGASGATGASTSTTDTATTGISIVSAGSSGTNANMPPYYALAFIMKS